MWVPVVIGVIAAVSIYAGMPIARSRRISDRIRMGLTAATVGVLLYLLTDVFSTANSTISGAYVSDPARALEFALLLAAGIAIGALILPFGVERLLRRSPRDGGLSRSDLGVSRRGSAPSAVSALEISTVTAVAIGVHNFSEGLAVGAAYAGGIVALSALLAFGVIAHKSAEGYCICGCASVASRDFTAAQLGLLGLIGGGPVVLGTIVGGAVGVDPTALVVIYGLAVGAILSVILVMFGTGLLRASRRLISSGIVVGFLLAFTTDFALTALGL